MSAKEISARQRIHQELDHSLQKFMYLPMPIGMCIIYAIINLVNGKCYIGQTRNKKGLKDRIRMHFKPSSPCIWIRNAVQHYGKHSFEVVVLELCSAEQTVRDAREEAAIAKYETLAPKGYNLQDGGSTSSPTEASSEKHRRTCGTAEWKVAQSARMKEIQNNPVVKATKIASYKKTALTPEFKEMKSKSQRKVWHREEYRAKITAARDVSLAEKMKKLRGMAKPLPPVEERILGAYYIDPEGLLRRWRKGGKLDKLTHEQFMKERERAKVKNKRKRDVASGG